MTTIAPDTSLSTLVREGSKIEHADAELQRLDALPLTVDDKAAVLAEVKDVFALNGALFTELS